MPPDEGIPDSDARGQAMGSVGDCYDNAMAESFFATLECELLDRTRFQDLRTFTAKGQGEPPDRATSPLKGPSRPTSARCP